MKKIIVANWKMNPDDVKEAKKIFASVSRVAGRLRRTEVVVCPPFVFLSEFKKPKGKVILGAQDVFWQEKGSYTGEVSPIMLRNLGVKYVIIGHSERRKYLGETNEVINKKVKTALMNGLKVILCVGEEKREPGSSFLKFVKQELEEGLGGIPRKLLKNLIIAYEPIWAIGKKGTEADTPEDAFQMSLYIRKSLLPLAGRDLVQKIPVLYGGSVDPKNAKGFLEIGLSGLLVGHESLVLDHFNDILKIAEKTK